MNYNLSIHDSAKFRMHEISQDRGKAEENTYQKVNRRQSRRNLLILSVIYFTVLGVVLGLVF